MQHDNNELKGLDGWLILVGIGVVIRPIYVLVALYSLLPLFSDSTWEAVTTVGSEAYHPLWGPLIIGEIIYNLVLVAVSIYLIYLFFSKHYLFPNFFIAILVASLIFIVLDSWFLILILPNEPMFDPETTKEFARAFVVGIIWIPYMLVSKRVKATFVEKIPNKSSTEHKKENYRSSNKIYISESDKHLISMLAKIAKSDGVVSKEEINVIDDFFIDILKLSDQERKEYINIFLRSKTSLISFEYHCKQFYNFNKSNIDLLKGALELIVLTAFADGKLSAEEEILINETIEIFGIQSQTYNSYKEINNDYQTSQYKNTEEYYFNILGLDKSASFKEIEIAYKKLATQYHPDKVAHLGPRLTEVAEEEMKKINEAYDYFKKKL